MTEPSRTEREQAVDALTKRLAHIRARLDKAQQRKQVELHIELADVSHFRARRRRRALARRPSPEVEAERLLQLRHWQAMAADSRRRMLEATSYEMAYAENDHARAQAKIRELSRKP